MTSLNLDNIQLTPEEKEAVVTYGDLSEILCNVARHIAQTLQKCNEQINDVFEIIADRLNDIDYVHIRDTTYIYMALCKECHIDPTKFAREFEAYIDTQDEIRSKDKATKQTKHE